MAKKDPNAAIFKKIKKVIERHERSLLKIPGVKAVGFGFKFTDGAWTETPAIVVSIGRKRDPAEVEAKHMIPEELDGVPIDVMVLDSWEQAHVDPYDRQDPLVGGLSISNGRFTGGAGTFGAIVYDDATDNPMGLTNHHVLFHNHVVKKTRIGDPIVQPGYSSPSAKNTIGHLARAAAPPLDCAVFYLNDSRALDTVNVLNGIAGRIKGAMMAYPGLEVKKFGARTKLTYGIVKQLFKHYMIIVPDPEKPCPGNEISDNGDSGALWVTDTPENIAVGLHNRGETVRDVDAEWAGAVHIELVLNKMKVHF